MLFFIGEFHKHLVGFELTTLPYMPFLTKVEVSFELQLTGIVE